MPLNYGDLKDKYIMLEGVAYRPYVHIFGELTPVALELCETLYRAQKELSKWPSDCYEGSLIGERRSRHAMSVDQHVDRSYNIKHRKKTKRSRRKRSGYFGRSFGKVPKQCW